MQPEVRAGQQRVEIRADGVEGDVAHVQQAGKADHDVQTERQHDVEQGEVDHAQPGIAKRTADDERENGQEDADSERRGDGRPLVLAQGIETEDHHARSATRSPINPDGRKTSTPISTKKAKMS